MRTLSFSGRDYRIAGTFEGIPNGIIPLLSMRTAEHNGIPVAVCVGRHIAKVRYAPIDYPAPCPVEFWRVAIRAVMGIGERLALFDLLRREGLRGDAEHPVFRSSVTERAAARRV